MWRECLLCGEQPGAVDSRVVGQVWWPCVARACWPATTGFDLPPRNWNFFFGGVPPGLFFTQLSATDVSVRTTMKGAAKCDKHCELQNSVNQQGFERILRFRDIPESMPASVSTSYHASGAFLASRQVNAGLRVSVHLSASAFDACSA